MYLVRRFSPIVAPILVGLASAGHGEPVETEPVGFSRTTLPAGSSVVVPTLLNAAVHAGTATFGETSVTPIRNPNWEDHAFAQTHFSNPIPNYPTHYAEVMEGPYEGYTYDIVDNTATTLTVPPGMVPPGLVGQSVKVTVRPHITLDRIVQGSSHLQAYSDAVTFRNEDGSVSVRYFNGSSWVAEDFSTPAGHSIIYPGSGVVFSKVGAVQLVFAGSVKTTRTAVPLYSGTVNFVGPLNPLSETRLVRTDLASSLRAFTDSLTTFSLEGKKAVTGVYYSNGGQLLDGGFNLLPMNAPDAIPGGSGVAVTVGADTVWIIKSPLSP